MCIYIYIYLIIYTVHTHTVCKQTFILNAINRFAALIFIQMFKKQEVNSLFNFMHIIVNSLFYSIFFNILYLALFLFQFYKFFPFY